MKLSQFLSFFVVLALIFAIWMLPQGMLNQYIPFFKYFGFQKLTALIVIIFVYSFNEKHHYFNFPGNIYFLFFIIGIIISFIAGVSENTYSGQIKLGEVNNSLKISRIYKGFIYFLSIIVIFRKEKDFLRLIKSVSIVALIFGIMSILGLGGWVVNFLGGIETITDKIEILDGESYNRFLFTFPTLDDNTFGGLLAGFVVLSLFMYYRNRNIIYLFIVIFFSFLIILTAGRSNSLKLLMSIVVFFAIYYRLLIKMVTYGLLILSLFIIIILNTEGGSFLINRWGLFFNNFSYIINTPINNLELVGNFSWRLLAAYASLPTNNIGWLFGNGGIQTGYVLGFNSASHMDLINWLSQYGLVTFIPLILFITTLYFQFKKLLIFKHLSISQANELRLLKSTGIALLVGFFIEIINSPMFYGFWFWLGIITLYAIHGRNKLRYLISLNKHTEII